MKIRVYYEDTDCGGVVYHSNYISYCERARSEFFFTRGISPHNKDSFFVVKKIEANYIQPAVLQDELNITINIVKLKSASCIVKQNIYRDNTLLFTAIITLAYVKELKPSKIPQEYLELFKELQ